MMKNTVDTDHHYCYEKNLCEFVYGGFIATATLTIHSILPSHHWWSFYVWVRDNQ